MTREEVKKIFCDLLLFGKAPCKKEELEDLCKVVLTALEQEPTTKNDLGVDCIDRDSIKYYPGQGGYMYASKGEIDKLPSVTPQEPRWIPVSTLPKAGEYIGYVAKYYLVQNEYGDMMVASYDGIGWQQMYQHGYVGDKVVAWMTLPQKYREVDK